MNFNDSDCENGVDNADGDVTKDVSNSDDFF